MSGPHLRHASWRKSSHSTANSNCVEVAFAENKAESRDTTAPAAWQKSSYSSANSNCVEVGFAGVTVGVRDSKHPTAGHLVVSGSGWAALRRVVCAETMGA